MLVWYDERKWKMVTETQLCIGSIKEQKAFIDGLQNALIVSISLISSYHSSKYLKDDIQTCTEVLLLSSGIYY